MQTPRIPVWVAGTAGAARPMRRAARYDGFVPIELDGPDQLAEAAAKVAELRSAAGTSADRPYDVVVALPVDTDPRRTPSRGDLVDPRARADRPVGHRDPGPDPARAVAERSCRDVTLVAFFHPPERG